MDRFTLMEPPPPPSPPKNPGIEDRNHQQQIPVRAGKRRGRKPSINSSAAQRNAANARERSRMRVLSTAFMKLKSVLPWVPQDTKLSKLDTLKLASGYITYLKSILDDPEAQGTSPSATPLPINSDPIFGTLMKGSSSRFNIKREQQIQLRASESKEPQVEYTEADGQVVQVCLQQPTCWTCCNGSIGCLNDPICIPSFSNHASATTTTTTATTNGFLIPSSSGLTSSPQPFTSSNVSDSPPTVVFQRQYPQ